MYKSARDGFMTNMVWLASAFVAASFLIPYLLRLTENEVTVAETTLNAIGIICFVAFLFWLLYGIRYEFTEDYLLVKGGPFRSRIRYEDVTKVEAKYFTVGETLAGYRLMASRDGVEIHYRSGLMGSVRISPERKEQFLEELEGHINLTRHKDEN